MTSPSPRRAEQKMAEQQWDLGRFVNTLAYFGAVPFLSGINWFQQWLGSRLDPTVDSRAMQAALQEAIDTMNQSMQPGQRPTIAVIGATGRLGTEAIRQLRQQGRAVWVLPAEQSVAVQQTGEFLPSLVPGTEVQPSPQPIDGILCCTDAIDFSPVLLTDWLPIAQCCRDRLPLFDFSRSDLDLPEIWGAVDDVVMGGVSQSRLELGRESANFTGQVSTANSGGFASVRTRNLSPAIDLSAFSGIELRVKGDGQRYKFMLRTETCWDGVAYSQSFDTIADRWITVQMPFDSLIPVFRARTVQSRFDSRAVCAMQLMLSKFEYDGALNPAFQPGLFQLQVASIQAYRDSKFPELVVLDPIDRPDWQLADRLKDQLANQPSTAGHPYLLVRATLSDAVRPDPDHPPASATAYSTPVYSTSASPTRVKLSHQPTDGSIDAGSIDAADLAALGIAAFSQPLINQTLYGSSDPQGIPIGDWDRLFGMQAKSDPHFQR